MGTIDNEHERHCNNLAQSDPPDYPHNWTPEQRLSAYWHALKIGAKPQTTAEWQSILTQAHRAADRHRQTVIELNP